MGTRSMILSTRPNDDDSRYVLMRLRDLFIPKGSVTLTWFFSIFRDGFTKWPFMTTHTWAEYPRGKWTLEVRWNFCFSPFFTRYLSFFTSFSTFSKNFFCYLVTYVRSAQKVIQHSTPVNWFTATYTSKIEYVSVAISNTLFLRNFTSREIIIKIAKCIRYALSKKSLYYFTHKIEKMQLFLNFNNKNLMHVIIEIFTFFFW